MGTILATLHGQILWLLYLTHEMSQSGPVEAREACHHSTAVSGRVCCGLWGCASSTSTMTGQAYLKSRLRGSDDPLAGPRLLL